MHILDLLSNGPSSFMAIYGTLNRLVASETKQFMVSELWKQMLVLSQKRLIRLKLMVPNGKFSSISQLDLLHIQKAYEKKLPDMNCEVHEMSVDEIGLWLEMTPAGRSTWEGVTKIDL